MFKKDKLLNVVWYSITRIKKVTLQTEQIKNIIAANGGMIWTAQVIDIGISKTVFYRYIKDNDMEQI